MINNDRRLDLSAKFVEMGQSLSMEGVEAKDLMITQAGTILIFLGGMMYSEKDMNLFSELCSMYSAKKMIENMEANNHDYTNYLKNKSQKETYEDFIKRINEMRKKNGYNPIDPNDNKE